MACYWPLHLFFYYFPSLGRFNLKHTLVGLVGGEDSVSEGVLVVETGRLIGWEELVDAKGYYGI